MIIGEAQSNSISQSDLSDAPGATSSLGETKPHAHEQQQSP